MKRILILGAGGMAGHVMAEYLAQKPEYEVIRCARRAATPDTILLDVTEFSHVEDVLGEQRPDIVINCVGMLIQTSRDRLDQAILINSYLPHFLSRLGIKLKYGFRLIHISTDCVFSGDRGGYAEDDFRDGDTPYARTKALGEVINDRDLTLRTSIIGPELKQNGTGLLHWFLMQKGEIKGFTSAYWSGVTTLELAKVVDDCIAHAITGLVNLTHHPADDMSPGWSPDGSRIAFSSFRDGRTAEVYVMDSDGENLVNLTNHSKDDRFRSWSSR